MFVFLAAPGDRAGSMTQVADARREAGAWAGPLHLRHLGVVVRAPEAQHRPVSPIPRGRATVGALSR